ncbi:group3 RNA polymerase ECF-type sigma factor SigG [Fusobacterium sp. CAG:439]|mgnify:FL=1|nr:group3 RNA polymerase ECF-type sigma factor SigG [Fusobacterium sp. CAG:439]
MSGNKLQYKKMPLEELVVLSQQNDFKALEELIKREQKNVFAAFSYLSSTKENVSDLTQEALLRVAKNIHNLKNPKLFKSWLNQIVTNLFYDELRKNQRKAETVSLDDDTEESSPIKFQLLDKKCKPHEKCISSELEKIIKNAILGLPEQFRIAIILRELQGLSYEEIAKATHSSIGTVKSRIARARGKLQEDLKAYI